MGAHGQGSCKQISDSKWECIVQSRFPSESGKPKRIKRKGISEEDARANALAALKEWENSFLQKSDVSNDHIKTVVSQKKKSNMKGIAIMSFGDLVLKYMEEQYRGTVRDVTYHSYYKGVRNYLLNDEISKLFLEKLNTDVFLEYYHRILDRFSRRTLSSPKSMCMKTCDWLMSIGLIEYNYAREAEGLIDPDKSKVHRLKKLKDEEDRKKSFSDDDILKFQESFDHNVSE